MAEGVTGGIRGLQDGADGPKMQPSRPRLKQEVEQEGTESGHDTVGYSSRSAPRIDSRNPSFNTTPSEALFLREHGLGARVAFCFLRSLLFMSFELADTRRYAPAWRGVAE